MKSINLGRVLTALISISLLASFSSASQASGASFVKNNDVAITDEFVTPPMGVCKAGWHYRNTSRGADSHSMVGYTQANYNLTSKPIKSTFSATVTGTVSATFSADAEVGGSIKLASIKAKFGISVTASLSVSLGNSITIEIPKKKTGNAQYGAWRAYVKGVEELYTTKCKITKTKNVTTYAPYKVGWKTWIS